LNNKQQMESKILTPEQALELLKQGIEIMVKPYDDDYENFTGITINDFEEETEKEILEYLEEKEQIEIWYEKVS